MLGDNLDTAQLQNDDNDDDCVCVRAPSLDEPPGHSRPLCWIQVIRHWLGCPSMLFLCQSNPQQHAVAEENTRADRAARMETAGTRAEGLGYLAAHFGEDAVLVSAVGCATPEM